MLHSSSRPLADLDSKDGSSAFSKMWSLATEHLGYYFSNTGSSRAPGLFDRLIADEYSRAGLEILTLDRKMASLSDVRRL